MADASTVAGQFIDAFNAHDEEAIRSLTAENASFEAPGDVKLEGADATVQYAMAWLTAFPDAKATVHDEHVAGDWVVQEFTFKGTHGGTLSSPAGDIPATGRELTGRGCQVIKVENDKVADTRLYFDQVQIMTQLGLMPEAAQAT